MTDDRYLEWKSAIAEARAAEDTKKLSSLQLDYNLELGECLAHQSQRTKDIKEELVEVKDSLSHVAQTVTGVDGRFGTLEAALVRTADNLSGLSRCVQDLVSYRDGFMAKQEGVKIAGKTLRAVILGIALVTGWAYAIYQAVITFVGE